ncbi:transglycosylase SLT domain-containing protein [Patescibacteria group bacterium]|jgi:hypothetical protein|nr:transglycosylase SLT domain-containing protein [Patescibacteria group bacterium]
MLKTLSISTVLVGLLVSVLPASAQEVALPSGIFRMANGAYYQPSSGTVTFNLADLGQNLPSTETVTVVSDSLSFPLKTAIARAKDVFEAEIASAAAASGPVVATTEAEWRPVTIAIWNPKTDAIRYVRLEKNGAKLKPLGSSLTGITVTYANGVNSAFRITGADGEVVVGVRYPIYLSRKQGTKTVYDVKEVFYSPYSSGVHTAEMIQEGKLWLTQTVREVYADLRAKQVKSRAFPDRLVADVIDPQFVASILLIEHVSPTAMKGAAIKQLESFAVILAANKDRSYNYSRSSAGALGLAQFIPSTYVAVAKWKEYELKPEFDAGMTDPKNAMKAQIAYLDYLLSRLPKETIASYDTNRPLVQEYVAAGYNGGISIVHKAMVVWEENLDPEERLIVRTRSRLKLETMQYVIKLRHVREALKGTDWFAF